MRFGVVPAHGPLFLKDAVQQVKLIEDYGFDSVWLEEHHASGPYWPAPLLAISALAPFTDQVTLGTNIMVLPLHDPVHVAEQAAVLDVMTGGRLILGVAIGDSAAEFAMFRVDAQRRGALFEEQIRLLRALWQGRPVSFSGRYYELREVTLSVAPVQADGPPIWIGGWGPMQLKRAAILGDGWLAGPVSDMPGVISRQASYDALVREQGQDPMRRARPVTRDALIATSDAKAWEMAERELLPAYQVEYLASDHPLIGTRSGSDFRNLRQLALDRFLIGDPDAVTRQTLACLDAIAANHFIFRLKLPGISPAAITEMLQLLGTEVLPQLRALRPVGDDGGLASDLRPKASLSLASGANDD